MIGIICWFMRITEKMKLIVIFRRINYLLIDLKITGIINNAFGLIITKRQLKNSPTQEMIDSREFFSKNNNRVNNVLSLLADEKSKTTFLDMIDFRCNRHLRFSEEINNSNHHFIPDISDIFEFQNDEVFIDCGAYCGDTIHSFKKYMKRHRKSYKKIVAFEPNIKWYRVLIHDHPDVIAFNSGVWSESTTLMFSGNLMLTQADSIKDDESVISIPVISIDSCQECENATFIKMDIEGAELNALIGAKKIIFKNKPKLAICIYHSNEEMLSIIEWLHKEFPQYKLYVRQLQKYSINETVLYATI